MNRSKSETSDLDVGEGGPSRHSLRGPGEGSLPRRVVTPHPARCSLHSQFATLSHRGRGGGVCHLIMGLPLDFGEIGHCMGCFADLIEQFEAILAQLSILDVHSDLLEKTVHRSTESRQRLHRAFEILA